MSNLLILTGLALCLAFHDLPAQTIIPEVGFTYSKTTRTTGETRYHYREVDFRQGIMAGLKVEVTIEDRLKFQTGLLYIEKGQKASDTGKQSTYYFTTRNFFLRYVQVPLLLKWNIKIKKIVIFPSMGPSIAYGLGGEVHSTMAFEDPTDGRILRGNQKGKVQFSEYREGYPADIFLGSPIDIGLQVGIGVLLFDKVVFEIGYNRGLKAFEFYYEEEDYNQNLQISVGMPFRMKKKGVLNGTSESM